MRIFKRTCFSKLLIGAIVNAHVYKPAHYFFNDRLNPFTAFGPSGYRSLIQHLKLCGILAHGIKNCLLDMVQEKIKTQILII
ncbi:MAG: hypothetical protein B9J98_01355 [Candidatus Terraquivivens tikiterensis]|uniref:Uncharacterized protein n=1 Tax=Candidatus Terraquivivens tikiterensis TaxID=1980982 RepID=A0A2R7Y9N7_9ARCH|nr:MAG: hypothetical protein B9J98_01355 [Candidatus Terraquivivens tikiterensis]